MERSLSLLIANIIIGVTVGLLVRYHHYAVAAGYAMVILLNNFDLAIKKIAGKDKL
jgi:hypothetical protein